MTNQQKLSLDDQLCFALFAATNAIAQSYQPKLEQIGITYPEYLVMLVVWQDSEVTAESVSARLTLSEAGADRILKDLEKSGYLIGHPHENGTGQLSFELSDAGRDLEIGAARVWNSVVCQTQMDLDELGHLRMELMALTQRMKSESEDCKKHYIDGLLNIAS